MEKIIFEIFLKVITGISPKIREELKNFVSSLELKAQETSNPVDDILVLFLRILVGL